MAFTWNGIAPDSQNVTHERPTYRTVTADGNEHIRAKHSQTIQVYSATYTLDDYADVTTIVTAYNSDFASTWTYYDWRDGTASAVTVTWSEPPQINVNRVGEYVVTIKVRRAYTA